MVNKKDRYEVLFEEILSQNKAIYELVEEVPVISQRLGHIEIELAALKATAVEIGEAVKTHSSDIKTLQIHTDFPMT